MESRFGNKVSTSTGKPSQKNGEFFQLYQGYNSLLIPLILGEKLGKETIQMLCVSMREHWAYVAGTCFS